VAEEAEEIGGVCLDEAIVDGGAGERAEVAELASEGVMQRTLIRE